MAAEKTFKIVVDDGSIRVPIENTHGVEIGEFMFRPTDIGMVKRYNTAAGKFEEVMEPLDKVANAEPAEGDGTDETSAAIEEAEKRLYDLVDYIFDGNMSEAFFGKMNPFSPIGGRFYCEIAMENLGNFIAAQFNDETKKISKRAAEYTKKYMKGAGK